MTRPSTNQLHVNLSASQTRKRLKGHGLGVRKVAATDRNQSVIVHTATGDHLRELESLFKDVVASPAEAALSRPVENLRNLGPASAAWLQEIGIFDAGDLTRLGPVCAYRLIEQLHPQTSLNLLWAMAGAISDHDWRDIPADEKERLKLELKSD